LVAHGIFVLFFYISLLLQALRTFKLGENALELAKQYYQLDGWVSDHLEILQELSGMYTSLANFESDIPRKW
jgi:hypothetical protein